jgi:hypothetical protein
MSSLAEGQDCGELSISDMQPWKKVALAALLLRSRWALPSITIAFWNNTFTKWNSGYHERDEDDDTSSSDCFPLSPNAQDVPDQPNSGDSTLPPQSFFSSLSRSVQPFSSETSRRTRFAEASKWTAERASERLIEMIFPGSVVAALFEVLQHNGRYRSG